MSGFVDSEFVKICDELVISPQDPNLWIQALQLIGNIEGKKVREEHIEEILQVNFKPAIWDIGMCRQM